jgi:hypothetical protein
MNILKKIKKNLTSKQELKMSEIIADFASGIMATAKDDYHRKSFLNCACTAWNISLFPKDQIENQLDISVKDYESHNPNSDDSVNYRHNLEQLIMLKYELYPDIKRMVVEASIENRGEKEKITVFSMPFQR